MASSTQQTPGECSAWPWGQPCMATAMAHRTMESSGCDASVKMVTNVRLRPYLYICLCLSWRVRA